jgi:hypothetical protein
VPSEMSESHKLSRKRFTFKGESDELIFGKFWTIYIDGPFSTVRVFLAGNVRQIVQF